MSVGANNKRKLRIILIAKYAEDNNWDVVLLSEIIADIDGVIKLGVNENLTAVVHSEKAAVLLKGLCLIRVMSHFDFLDPEINRLLNKYI